MRRVNLRSLAVGSHLCCQSGFVYRKPLRMAALTWDLLLDHMTSQYELYFDRRDKLLPDHQSYSETIYACGFRLNSFVARFFIYILSIEGQATDDQGNEVTESFHVVQYALETVPNLTQYCISCMSQNNYQAHLKCNNKLVLFSPMPGHVSQSGWPVSADRRRWRCSICLAGPRPQTAVHLPRL